MRILFTGATSFTGMWFVEQLARKGHDIVAFLQRAPEEYEGLRAFRLKRVQSGSTIVSRAPFGSDAMLKAIKQGLPFDLLCHHGAEVTDYKSLSFDVEAAVSANTFALPKVLSELRDQGCRRILLTGTVFEADEGAGSDTLLAFSPYGMSKTITAQIFKKTAGSHGMGLGKFVIPNPFGPYEEPRFTNYLMQCWKDGGTPRIATPLYVRDNIPVSLLAAAYERFAANLPEQGFMRYNPSCYVEQQADFARRFASEMSRRLYMAVPLSFAEQSEFPEPLIRFNTDPVREAGLEWSEIGFWDEMASYYADKLGIQTL